ncbi:hypothetical protein B5F14_09775 [Faecalitalea cylindroides]|uniref:Glycosyltransferase 2-like domain-containing protein n=1 Tax=Faecalitalea cylindroides TaxID=39483 RepID=A0A1Y4LQ07_9FIRM|nr:glycosyltransferase family 2 protein [Faecalitalea cylindroides]OUP56312.1 hypothetical protein B5F14_09775 [Faecalitalea cylindroides]
MLNGKVSVIIPIYQVEKYLERCIKSVINQSYKNIEIILIDDGSTDHCPTICDEYAQKDSRIIVIHKQNGGLSSARNSGLSACSGDYVSFIDSDDYIDEHMIETMVKKIETTNSDIVCCGFYFEMDNGYFSKSFMPDLILNRSNAIDALIENTYLNHYSWNKLYKKKVFKNVYFPEGKLFEDIRTTYKLFLNADKVCLIDEYLYHYQIRRNSIISSSKGDKVFEIFNAYQVLKHDLIRLYPDKKSLIIKSEMNILINQYMELYKWRTNVEEFKLQNTYNLFRNDYHMLTQFTMKERLKYFFFLTSPKLFCQLKERKSQKNAVN